MAEAQFDLEKFIDLIRARSAEVDALSRRVFASTAGALPTGEAAAFRAGIEAELREHVASAMRFAGQINVALADCRQDDAERLMDAALEFGTAATRLKAVMADYSQSGAPLPGKVAS